MSNLAWIIITAIVLIASIVTIRYVRTHGLPGRVRAIGGGGFNPLWIAVILGGSITLIILFTLWPFDGISSTNPLLYIGIIVLAVCGAVLSGGGRRWMVFGTWMTRLAAFAFVVLTVTTLIRDKSKEVVDESFSYQLEQVSTEAAGRDLFMDVVCEDDWRDEALATWLEQIPETDFKRRRAARNYAKTLFEECPGEKEVDKKKTAPEVIADNPPGWKRDERTFIAHPDRFAEHFLNCGMDAQGVPIPVTLTNVSTGSKEDDKRVLIGDLETTVYEYRKRMPRFSITRVTIKSDVRRKEYVKFIYDC